MSPLHVPVTCRLSVYYTRFCRCSMSLQHVPATWTLVSGRLNKGPRIVPWGTPHLTNFWVDIKEFIRQVWVRLLKYDANHLWHKPRIPQNCNFCNRMLVNIGIDGVESLFQIQKNNGIDETVININDQLSVALSINAVTVESRERNPDW